MQMTTRAKVTGATFFNDVIEGSRHDFTKVHLEMPLDDTTGRAKGYATQALNWGTSEEFGRIKHLPFPFEADITIELVTSGKVQKQRIVSLKPIQQVK